MAPSNTAGWNLATRFGLEVGALVSLGVAGWKFGSGGLGWILAIGAPVAAAAAWTTFNVPGDPSRSGRAPVEVNGWVRLGVELTILGSGAVAIWFAGRSGLALAYTAIVVAQYATSLDRVNWLIGQ